MAIKDKVKSIEKKVKKDHDPQKSRVFHVTFNEKGEIIYKGGNYKNLGEFAKSKKLGEGDRVIYFPEKKPPGVPVDISKDNKIG